MMIFNNPFRYHQYVPSKNRQRKCQQGLHVYSPPEYQCDHCSAFMPKPKTK